MQKRKISQSYIEIHDNGVASMTVVDSKGNKYWIAINEYKE
jgi:hypothetical protein